MATKEASTGPISRQFLTEAAGGDKLDSTGDVLDTAFDGLRLMVAGHVKNGGQDRAVVRCDAEGILVH